jgi:hypothetical protein
MSQQYTVSEEESASIKAARDARLSQSTDAETAARLADHAERIRDVHRQAARDPGHVYHGRTDLRDKHEAEISALYFRAGIVQPKQLSPQEMAIQKHEAGFQLGATINPGLAQLIDTHLEALAADPAKMADAEKALKQRLGPAAYSDLLADAKAYLGANFKPAVAASEQALTIAANQFRYNERRASVRKSVMGR